MLSFAQDAKYYLAQEKSAHDTQSKPPSGVDPVPPFVDSGKPVLHFPLLDHIQYIAKPKACQCFL